jgi:hypothetical protein
MYELDYAGKRKRMRREIFLAEVDQVVPWKSLLSLIEPVYSVAGNGRPSYPRATMLRIHLMQTWFGLSDRQKVEALHKVASTRQFAGLSLPDRFRRDHVSISGTYDLAAMIFTRLSQSARAYYSNTAAWRPPMICWLWERSQRP